jgi:hypothetical protein
MLSKRPRRGSIRYSIRYRIQSPELTKESRHKVGLKSRRLRTKITPKPVPRSLTEEGSVRGRSLHHLPDQPGTRISLCSCSLRRTDPYFSKVVFVFVETDRPGFFKPIFQVESGNEVSLTLIINDQTLEVRLIGIIN